MTLHDFLAELGRRGKSVTATGGTDHQTLAGLISTGTAPASSRHALYDLLDWVELVARRPGDRARGGAAHRRAATPTSRPSCARSGCSACSRASASGSWTSCYFSVVQKIVDLDDVLADLDATSAKYDFWRVNWVPKTDKALLWAATAVPREQSKPDGDYPTDQSEHLLDVVFEVIDKLVDTGPLLTDALELVYDVMALTYGTSARHGPAAQHAPGRPSRAAARGDGRVELPAARRPPRARRVRGRTSTAHGWPNIPTEIELTRVDGELMSPWNWEGLPYVVKFNFMYLTEVCTEPGEKEAIYAHLRGLWEHLQAAGVPFKAHWGKINFIDPEFVRRNHDLDAFRPLISPMFVNDYLAERIGVMTPTLGRPFPGLTDIHAHPAMNAFLWDRDLRRHYWTGRTFDPLASLTDFKMLEKGGVKVLWSSLHIPEREYFDCWFIRLAAHFSSRRAQAAQAERLGMPAGDDGRDGAAGGARGRPLRGGALQRRAGPGAGGGQDGDRPHRRGRPRPRRRARRRTTSTGDSRGWRSSPSAASRRSPSRTCSPTTSPDTPRAFPTASASFPICPLDTGVDLERGLTPTGRAVVERMVELRMIPDVTHCTPVARRDVYQLVANRVPVIASHIGVQSMNSEKYNLDEADVRAIAALWRGGRGDLHALLARRSHPGPGLDAIWRTMDELREWSGGSWEHVAHRNRLRRLHRSPRRLRQRGGAAADPRDAGSPRGLAERRRGRAGRQRAARAPRRVAVGHAAAPSGSRGREVAVGGRPGALGGIGVGMMEEVVGALVRAPP